MLARVARRSNSSDSRAPSAAVFDFETVALGTTTPFSSTADGVTASFSSAPGVGAFRVDNASAYSFVTLQGRTLIEFATNGNALTVAVGQSLGSVSMNFATNTSSALTLVAYQGSNAVGSSVVTGSVPAGGAFYEGVVGFSGASFDRIVLSSSALFAVDNMDVTPLSTAAVPAPWPPCPSR